MIKENILYTALSPISHNGDETLSNTVPFRRQTIVVENEIEEVADYIDSIQTIQVSMKK